MISRTIELSDRKIPLLEKEIKELKFKLVEEKIYKIYKKNDSLIKIKKGSNEIIIVLMEIDYNDLKNRLLKSTEIFEYEYYIGVDETKGRSIVVSASFTNKKGTINLLLNGIKDSKKIKDVEKYNKIINSEILDVETKIINEEKIEELKKRFKLSIPKIQTLITALTIFSLVEKVKKFNIFNNNTQIYFDSFDTINTDLLLEELKTNLKNIEIYTSPNAEKEDILVATSSILSKIKFNELGNNNLDSLIDISKIKFISFKKITSADSNSIINMLEENLIKFYPGVIDWYKSKIMIAPNSNNNRSYCIKINDEIAGLILTKYEENTGKIRNIFIKGKYRKKFFGELLILQEFHYAIKNNIKYLTITLAEENRYLISFFNKFGFVYVGHSFGKYRKKITELHLIKSFENDFLTNDNIIGFILENQFEKNCFHHKKIKKNLFLLINKVETTYFYEFNQNNRYLIEFILKDNITEKELEKLIQISNEYNAKPILFVNDSKIVNKYKNISIIDIKEIRERYFPLEYSFSEDNSAVIVPINPKYADNLFLNVDQSTLGYKKESYRLENVYYRSKNRIDYFKSGKTVFFL